MGWKQVILFALIAGLYTGVIALIPALERMSLHDIAVYPEWWLMFAVLIVVNCEKRLEAALKCFVFFLISQPLVYLIQVPFYADGWEIFNYYRPWFIATLLTIPAALIAFEVKKKNWLSVIVLSVATGLLAYLAAMYLKSTVSSFPYHLLSMLFCLAAAVFLIFALLDKKKHRFVALLITLAVLIASIAVFGVGRVNAQASFELPEGQWTATVEDTSIVSVQVGDEGAALIRGIANGNTFVTFQNEDGETKEIAVTVSGREIFISDL